MATITRTIDLIPRKPKYMRWKKWYATKKYQDWAVTPEKLNKLIDKLPFIVENKKIGGE